MVDLDPSAFVTVYDYVAIKRELEILLGQPVDLVDRQGLVSSLQGPLTRDLVYAF